MGQKHFFTLISTESDTTTFKNAKNTAFEMDTRHLFYSGMIEFFTIKDTQKIINASKIAKTKAIVHLRGSSLFIPSSRIKYLFILAIILTIAFIFSIPMHLRSVTMDPFYTAFPNMIFPLIFIATNLINELFGRRTTKNIISAAVISIMVVAGLMKIATLLSDQANLSTLFFNLSPQSVKTTFTHAFALLITCIASTYLFTYMKAYSRTHAFWMRSLLSNFFGIFSYKVLFTLIFYLELDEFLDLNLPQKPMLIFQAIVIHSGLTFLYLLAYIPILYVIILYIHYRESQEFHIPESIRSSL